MKYIIFDLDGCISDDRHRRHLLPEIMDEQDVKQDAFNTYHELCWKDAPINRELLQDAIIQQRKNLQIEPLMIVFCTARPRKFEKPTRSWLEAHFGSFEYALLMRPDGDHRSSPELKVALIDEAKIPWENVEAAYDDRDEVLDAYFDAGLELMRNKRLQYPLKQTEHTSNVAESVIKTQERGVPEILRGMAETYEERNVVYGDNYKRVGRVMEVLFPDGISAELLHSDHWHLFELKVVKLTRFAISNLEHIDSIHDDAVYSAMIESILRKENSATTN